MSAPACVHPGAALLGTFIPGETEDDTQLSVSCASCKAVWNQDTVPIDVLAVVVNRLDSKVRVRDGLDPQQVRGL
ncbi:hypothetical protein [Lentzea sp. NBRC 102530]|uniref:hypothetical protein n=1 Tax=Lentzea sp. NBRC 102530 TaxID=3032201 RepID=UPI0024A3E3EA|nr:hypothetical protein [Lentzea sp. NBRC 102530]GLY55196.1 hypothetical protein Lesp01_88510 [Lentzea sp. NBRC 102530]